jgi:hypothetical protein
LFLFSDAQSSSVSNNRPPSQDGTWLSHSEIWGMAKWLSFPMQACHRGGVTIKSNPQSGLKAVESVG